MHAQFYTESRTSPSNLVSCQTRQGYLAPAQWLVAALRKLPLWNGSEKNRPWQPFSEQMLKNELTLLQVVEMAGRKFTKQQYYFPPSQLPDNYTAVCIPAA